MSDFELTPGIRGENKQVVEQKDTAVNYGSGLVEVFATPAMIALMEKTCLESLLKFLPDTYSTVGTLVNVSHVKATPMGMQVYCQSELIEVDRKRLVFKVKAFDEDGLIGEGTHERFVIDKAKFMSRLS